MTALTIAEAVTGTPAAVLARASRLNLLDSALHAPQAGFGDVEFYPDFANKAAVLTVRIVSTSPVRNDQTTTWMPVKQAQAYRSRSLLTRSDLEHPAEPLEPAGREHRRPALATIRVHAEVDR